jgi:hypothetical protein
VLWQLERVNETCLTGKIFRTNVTRLSGRSASQVSAIDTANTRLILADRQLSRTSCRDRDSHGVSDPSGQTRGHIGRSGVAHAMITCPDRDIRTLRWVA